MAFTSVVGAPAWRARWHMRSRKGGGGGGGAVQPRRAGGGGGGGGGERASSRKKSVSEAAGAPRSEKNTAASQPRPADADAGGDEALLTDIARMRQNRELERRQEGLLQRGGKAVEGGVRGVVSTALLYNFFVVLFFLGWLLVGAGAHFAANNDSLLNPWLRIWEPLIKPLITVQMLATILSGTISKLNSSE